MVVSTMSPLHRALVAAVTVVVWLATGLALTVVAAAPASAAPDDAHCLVQPYLADCQGGAFGLPSDSGSAGCAMDPADAVCGPGGPGNPGGPPAMPPPIGSDLPGSLNPDGTPFGSEPIGGTGMIGTPGGMGGIGGIGGIGGPP